MGLVPMRISIIAILLFSAIFAFSQESGEISLHGRYNFSANFDSSDSYSHTISTVIGFTGIHYFNDSLGLFINLNLNFPFVNMTSFDNTLYTTHWGDGIFWIGIEGLFGAVFIPVNEERFRIPIAVGVNMMSMTTIHDGIGAITRNYGFGMNFGFQYYVNKNISISLKIFCYVNLISMNERENIYEFFTDGKKFDNKNWGIAPMIGIGFRL